MGSAFTVVICLILNIAVWALVFWCCFPTCTPLQRIKRKWQKKRIYPSLREMRKDLEELGEDSEMEEDFTEDEEEKIVELIVKHS